MDSLKKMHRNTLIFAGIADASVILIMSFCFFIHQSWIPLGFALGAALSYANYFILYVFSYKITRPYHPDKKWIILSYLLRMLVYASGLVLALLFQYSFGWKIFFWGSVLGGYLLMIIVIAFAYNPKLQHSEREQAKDL